MFKMFPTINYDSIGNGETKVVTDLLRRVAARSKVRVNTLLFDYYDIKEGETPEIVADKFYGDQKKSWIVLLVNDITDRYHKWPLPYYEWIAFVNDKYDNVNATHHYYITQSSGNTDVRINIGADKTDHAGATAVTNADYEEDLQNQMRRIRILGGRYVDQFEEEFESLIKEEL